MPGASYTPYREIGNIPGLRLLFTPEALLWYNSNRTPTEEREQFLRKVQNMYTDIREKGRPRRGRVKSARACEVPVLYLRLSKDQRIFFDYKPAKHTKDDVVIYILAVSDKSNFQARLASSAEHKVHASAFDQLPWDDSDGSAELDLESTTDQEFHAFRENIKREFTALTEADRADGWSSEAYSKRITRATIYDVRFPHIDLREYTFEDGVPEILKLQPLQEKMLVENRDVFLLEGVAGTGKTTILLYRLVQYARALLDSEEFDKSRFLFVTHNERLRDEVQNLLRFFFQGDELKDVQACILSVEDAIQARLGERNERFKPEHRLTRDEFRGMMNSSGVDTDLFWEEYRGILRGYNLQSETDLVSRETYLEEIGRRRGRIDVTEREGFHALATDFQERLQKHPVFSPEKGGWDDLDICREMMDFIRADSDSRTLDFLLIDEVQDLTTAEVVVFLNLLDPEGYRNISMAGDLSQSVQPSAFTWQSLRETIYAQLGIKVSEEYRLDENFRSTPYLVHAANLVLKHLSEFNNESLTNIQRPFAGENSGEPLLLFFEKNERLVQSLAENGLPNDNCVLLVRDESTKLWLESQLPEEQAAFIETIAKFKGLEQENILLWDPVSGSERILDMLYHPVRKEKARAKKSNISTAIIELKHLFVGLTRARYLMGVLLPGGQEKQHYFVDSFNDAEFTSVAEIERINLFCTLNVDPEIQRERAERFLHAGQYRMGAQVYQNMGEFEAYHYYMGEHHKEKQNYQEAVNAYSSSLDEGDKYQETAKRSIAKIALYAIAEADTNEAKEAMESKVRLNAGSYLGRPALARLKAEAELRRGNVVLAATSYVEAGEVEAAKSLLPRIDNRLTRAVLQVGIGDMDSAEQSFRSHLETVIEQAIVLALKGGKDGKTASLFPPELGGLKPRFQPNDLVWAKQLARKLPAEQSNSWLRLISRHEDDIKLAVSAQDYSQAKAKFDIHMKRKDYKSAREVLEQESHLATKKHTLGFFVASKYLSERDLLEDLITRLDQNTEDSAEASLDNMLDTLGQHWLKRDHHKVCLELHDFMSNYLEEHGFTHVNLDDKNASGKSSERLISLGLLATYLVLIQRNDVTSLKTFFEKCRKMAKRTNQPVVAGAASLLALHLSDPDHPQHPGLSKGEITAASVLFHLYGKREYDKKGVFALILVHSLGKKYKNTPSLDDLQVNIKELYLRLSNEQRRRLIYAAVQHTKGKLTGAFYRLPAAMRTEFKHELSWIVGEVMEILSLRRVSGNKLPKISDLEVLPVYTRAHDLHRFVNRDLTWFAKTISGNLPFAEIWNSPIVDRLDEGQTEDAFQGFIEEDDDSQPIEQGQEDIRDQPPNSGDEESDEGTEEKDETEQEGPEAEIMLGSPSEFEVDLESLLDNVEVAALEAPSVERVSVLHSDLYEEVCQIDPTPNGKSHIETLCLLIEKRLPHPPKERSDVLHAALNDVHTYPWEPFFKMAVILAVRDFSVTESDAQGNTIQYEYDTKNTKDLVRQFAMKNRGSIAQSGMAYAQSVFNLT